VEEEGKEKKGEKKKACLSVGDKEQSGGVATFGRESNLATLER